MIVPVCDPVRGYISKKAELDSAIASVLIEGNYILGSNVTQFENAFAKFIGTSDCIGVASGTDAVEIALRACGVTEGMGVITPSHTAVATVVGILRAGATPVFVDIDPKTFTLDVNKVEDTLKTSSHNIRAIVAVHLYGHAADMHAISALSAAYQLFLIEDCAQAHGAKFANQTVGSFGDAAAFSFYPTKNLSAFGDGGAVVTSSREIADRCRALRQYGWRTRYLSESFGINSRLDEIQATVLEVKLKYLESDNVVRQNIAQKYLKHLAPLALALPRPNTNIFHAYHQFVVQTNKRDALRQFLKSWGIGTNVLYPQAVHQQSAFLNQFPVGAGGLNATEKVVAEILGLPIFPELTAFETDMVVEKIVEWFQA